jgi:NAD(P)-dependent dehydrogenase (short-subunit alcohol dehydrogenase family)
MEHAVAVITGASSGVGRARARVRPSRRAHRPDRSRSRGLDSARREVEELGGRALVFPLDVADPKAVEAAAADIEE